MCLDLKGLLDNVSPTFLHDTLFFANHRFHIEEVHACILKSSELLKVEDPSNKLLAFNLSLIFLTQNFNVLEEPFESLFILRNSTQYLKIEVA